MSTIKSMCITSTNTVYYSFSLNSAIMINRTVSIYFIYTIIVCSFEDNYIIIVTDKDDIWCIYMYKCTYQCYTYIHRISSLSVIIIFDMKCNNIVDRVITYIIKIYRNNNNNDITETIKDQIILMIIYSILWYNNQII